MIFVVGKELCREMSLSVPEDNRCQQLVGRFPTELVHL